MTGTDLTLMGDSPFDAIRRTDERGEYWSARDLMPLLGYEKWERFEDAIDRACISIRNAGNDPERNASRLREPSGKTERVNYRLSRYGAYVVAMSGDVRKTEIAEAQAYFAAKTHEAETAPALPDLSTPAGLLAMAEQFASTARQLVAAEEHLAEQAPLVAQAESHRAGFRDVTRQEFAREVVTWGEQHGVVVKHQHVFAFLVHIGLFVAPNRSDSGHAKTDAIRRDLAVTAKGTTEGGRNYATGKLTPKGQGYAWDRIVRHVEANGTLELPRQIGEAS